MFCPKCGTKNEDGDRFCSNCGECLEEFSPKNGAVSVGVGNGTAAPKKKKRRVGLISLGVVILLLVLVVGMKIYSYKESIPTDEEIQMANNNLQNGGNVASDGSWLYYCDDGLRKVRLEDSSKNTLISGDTNIEEMFWAGDSLYYYMFPAIYRAEDGKIPESDLGFSVFTQNCFQTDGKKYYVTGSGNYDEGGIYASSVHNIEKSTCISDILPTFLYLHQDYLYVLSGYSSIDDEPNENYGVWRMDKKGKNSSLLLEFCPKYFVIYGDTIYYTDEWGDICSMNLDGTDQKTCGGSTNRGLNVSEEYVFYIDEGDHSIVRMDRDGSNKTLLNDNRCEDLNIIDNWLFYRNEDDDYQLYRMSFDGNYNCPISEEVVDTGNNVESELKKEENFETQNYGFIDKSNPQIFGSYKGEGRELTIDLSGMVMMDDEYGNVEQLSDAEYLFDFENYISLTAEMTEEGDLYITSENDVWTPVLFYRVYGTDECIEVSELLDKDIDTINTVVPKEQYEWYEEYGFYGDAMFGVRFFVEDDNVYDVSITTYHNYTICEVFIGEEYEDAATKLEQKGYNEVQNKESWDDGWRLCVWENDQGLEITIETYDEKVNNIHITEKNI